LNSLGTILVAIITSAATAAGSVYAIQRYDLIPPRPSPKVTSEVTVPALNGLTETDARANLKALGLVYLAAPREASAEVKPGSVVRQSVAPGQRVAREHAISVTLADELPKAPDLMGLNATDAAVRIAQSGHKMEIGEPLAREGAAEGTVVEQTPKADAPLAKDGSIVIRLALTQPVDMPKVVGQSVNTAKTALEKLGLKVNVRWTSLAETATFVVLSQKPAAKAKLKPGDEVEISANR
jgi:serine/threonine-protein kinase